MKKYLLDSNYILRYLLNDISSQADIVGQYIQKAKKGEVAISAPFIVFLECVFILTKLYKFSRVQVVESLIKFISIPFIEIEQRNFLLTTLLFYRDATISYIDTILYLEARGSDREILTFDKKLLKLGKKT